MRVVQNMINNQEFRKRKRERELGFYSPMITKAPRYRAMSQQASCRSFRMFWGCYANFLLTNQRMSQVVSLSHMLGVPQSSKTGAEKFRKSNRLWAVSTKTICVAALHQSLWHRIPDVVYHVIGWKRWWVPGWGLYLKVKWGESSQEKITDSHFWISWGI